MESVKIVAVGDGAVGKTSMLISYTSGVFPKDYVPTIFDNYVANVMVEGTPISLGLWDTAGQEEYDRLRPLSYPSTDCFLVAYSVDSKTSLKNVESTWVPELRRFCPDTPILLVGTKLDMRENHYKYANVEFVDDKDAEQVARDIGAAEHLTCSALTEKNLKKVFDTMVGIALKDREIKKKSVKFGKARKKLLGMCTIM
eukprot:g333.t1